MHTMLRTRGMIPLFPDIMVESEHAANSTQCLCFDLQTEDYSPLYAWYNYVLIILALPSLSVFGVCTNIINVFIYSRKRMQNSANTYLLFLACSDFLVILTGLFIFWIDSARSYIPELQRAPYTTIYTLPFGYMAQTCSIYFTVAAAFDCYINVCWKPLAKSYCSVKRAKQICFTIVVISIMYNSLRFPQFNLRKCFHEASQEQIIEICPTSLFFTINMVYNVYMYMVLMTLLPFLFLLCLNAIIMLKQSIDTKKMPHESVDHIDSPIKLQITSSSSGGTSEDTITMIMVVILFLACNTLALFVNVFETFFDPDPLVLNLLSDASNFLVVFNSSVNCVIYFVFNTEYRGIFKLLFRKFCRLARDEYCCCERKRRTQQRGIYHAVNTKTIHHKITKPSIRNDIPTADVTIGIVASDVGEHSPVWQPLTQRRMKNLEWPSGCFDPSSHMILMDDDGDSGWDDATSSQVRDESSDRGGKDDNIYNRPYTNTRWLAEVNIIDNGGQNGMNPVVTVKSNGNISERNSINITAL